MFGSIKDEKKKINTNGIGLGLVISKLIAHKFGGEVDFFSKWKKGSTFYYTMQLEEQAQNTISSIQRRSTFTSKRSSEM
jgi:K+-sensing histidine kinase KdpD